MNIELTMLGPVTMTKFASKLAYWKENKKMTS